MAEKTLSADLIADIYEAAVDDERWPAIAQIVASAARFTGTALWIVDQGQVLDLSVTADLLPTREPYLYHYAKLDPWQHGLLTQPWDQVRLGAETFPERELLKTEFYNDFARPNGIHRPMGAMMRLGRSTFATVAANRPLDKKIFESEDAPRLERLLPHLRRALQLRLQRRKYAPASAMHVGALDALAFGIVVCDGNGRVAFANRSAEAMARNGSGLVLGNRKKGVAAIAASQSRRLLALLHDAACGGPGGVMQLTGRSGQAETLALVTPLPRNMRINRVAPAHYALLTLRPVWDSPSFSTEMLTALFGLSPAQAEIALAIFDGEDPETIAAKRNVAISTLRTHITEILARTGTKNQRDLVRLLALVPPVRMGADTDGLGIVAQARKRIR